MKWIKKNAKKTPIYATISQVIYTETRSVLDKRAMALERKKCLYQMYCRKGGDTKGNIQIWDPTRNLPLSCRCSSLERDLMIQLNRVVKRSASILDVESTKALYVFGRHLDSQNISNADFEKSKELLSTKIGRERAKAKHRYSEQLISTKQNY